MLPLESFVHDADSVAAEIGLGEGAAFQDGHAHRLEIIRRHDGEVAQPSLPRPGRRLSFDADAGLPAAEAHGQRSDEGGRSHAGKPPHRFDRLLVEPRPLRVVGIFVGRQAEIHGEDIFGIQSDRHGLQAAEAAEQQPRRDQQHERESDFADNQQTPAPAASHGDGFAAPAFLQRLRGIAVRQLPCGRETEQQPGGDGDGEREEQHGPVNVQRHEFADLRGQQVRQQRHSPERQHKSGKTAGAREQQAFDEQLPEQPPAAGAEREPHRDFLPPLRRTAEQEVGHVGAGDEQHDQHRPEQRRQRRADARSRQAFLQRHHGDAVARVAFGIFLGQSRGHAFQVAARRGKFNAGLQPPDDIHARMPAARLRPRGLVPDRRPQLDTTGKLERRGQDPHDRVAFAVE